MKKRKKYLLLVLLLILPVVFYSLSELKVNDKGDNGATNVIESEDDGTLAASSYNYYSCEVCSLKPNVFVRTEKESALTSSGVKKCISYTDTRTALRKASYCYTGSGNKANRYTASLSCSNENYKNLPGKFTCTLKKATSCSSVPVKLCSSYSDCTVSGGKCSSKSSSSNNNATTINAYKYINQDIKTNTHTLKKCDKVYVKTCQGNSQGSICSYTYNGSSGTGLNSKYYSSSLPSDCSNNNGGSNNNTKSCTSIRDSSVCEKTSGCIWRQQACYSTGSGGNSDTPSDTPSRDNSYTLSAMR